jgi:hypothetical protein
VFMVDRRFPVYRAMEAVFEASSSEGTLDPILEAYGISKNAPMEANHKALTQFITEVEFSQPIARARNFFWAVQPERASTQSQNSKDIAHHRTTVDVYKVIFGNPFPGPLHGIAHHCVEMIYQFDAFPKDLMLADQELASDKTKEDSLVTHAALRDAIQDKWIKFVVNGNSQKDPEADSLGETSEATVYGVDRVARKEDFRNGAEWVKQQERFDVLDKHRSAADCLHHTLQGEFF